MRLKAIQVLNLVSWQQMCALRYCIENHSQECVNKAKKTHENPFRHQEKSIRIRRNG